MPYHMSFHPAFGHSRQQYCRGDFGVGGGRTQFHSLSSHFAAKILKHEVQLLHFFMGSCITPVHSANRGVTQRQGSPALSKARLTECQQWGILTTKSCFHPATVAMAPATPERGDSEQATCANHTRACFLFLSLGLSKGLAGL